MRPFLYIITLGILLCSCVWDSNSGSDEYLPLDDSQYPYAGLPRIVIETDDFAQIRDRETKHPARLQIYGESSPEGGIKDLTIRGRGNSSFVMTKYGIKLEFNDKEEMLGMPKNRDWALVSNFRDKSFLRNHITFQLANTLEAPYSPRSRFVELYLNKQYMGLYMLTEHIKVGKNRVNIPDNDSSFLVEKTMDKQGAPYADASYKELLDQGQKFYFKTDVGRVFKIESPKKPSEDAFELIQKHFSDFERYMDSEGFENHPIDSLAKWIDVNDFIRYYWIQEFSKNIDGSFRRSIFMTWQKGEPMKMGPVWDFDLAYGIGNEKMMSPNDYYARTQSWYKMIFRNKAFKQAAQNYWKNHSSAFRAMRDSIPSIQEKISKAVLNDEKRWPILENDYDWPFVNTYPDHQSAVDSLKNWISQRAEWISSHL